MQSFYTSLDYQALLEISGEDSEKFLQGQLTCDLAIMPEGGVQLGAVCNNKGRVYASFRVLKTNGCFHLAMQPGMLAITQKNLAKYIPFYKARMQDSGDRFHRAGLAGPLAEEHLKAIVPALPPAGQSLVTPHGLLLNLGGAVPRYELWTEPEDKPVQDYGGLEQAPPEAWMALDVAAGIFLINPDDVELYTPEEINLDLAGFISFDKGCYTGQEIVARMHYRGKAGKRLFLVSMETTQGSNGQHLKDASGKTLGIITNLLHLKDYSLGFSVLKSAADLAQAIWLEDGDMRIPVSISPLSYP